MVPIKPETRCPVSTCGLFIVFTCTWAPCLCEPLEALAVLTDLSTLASSVPGPPDRTQQAVGEVERLEHQSQISRHCSVVGKEPFPAFATMGLDAR